MADSINYAGTGAFIGGAIGGPLGAGIGGAIGFGVGLFSDISGADNKNKADALQAESDILNYTTESDMTGIKILQAKADVSAYDSFLAAFPNYAELQKNTFEAQSRGEFRGLLNNYAMGNVGAGATGRVGGSAGLVAKEAQDEFIDFTGADMELGGRDGGRYQMAGDEMTNNLTMQEQQARTQRDILVTSIPMLEAAQKGYDDAEASARARLATANQPLGQGITDALKPIAEFINNNPFLDFLQSIHIGQG